ncbi:MAG TPA: hypothetical protein VEZ12_16955 [Herpetosiphonaceae bacterium]|nr:hypothetical protein [Herpetosiphonaceae bacterium]
MAGIVFACIAPHGVPLVAALDADAEGGLATRGAMEELGRRCAAARPDVLVVATPHGTRVDGAICLAAAARGVGTLRWRERQVELNVPIDTMLTDQLASAAGTAGVPMALASFGANQREQSVIPLDWGTMVPLWFLGHGRNLAGHGDLMAMPPQEDSGSPVVIAAPSRVPSRRAMITFWRAIAEAALHDGRRIGFVASCDWSHTHRSDGPYGFHPAAAEVDAIVVRAVEDQRIERLIDLPQQLAQDAAIDGLWQTLMLAGVLQHTPLHGELLSYEAPTYYGMLVAAFVSRVHPQA